jgi:superfamily II DNA or RNA helicase
LIIKINNVNCNIEIEEHDQKAHLRQLKKFLSTKAPSFQFTGAYKLFRKTRGEHGWDGNVYLLNNLMFPTGLVPKVEEFLRRKTRLTIIDERIMRKLSCSSTTVDLRDYQEAAIRSAIQNTWKGLWFPRGIFGLSTGSGKTIIAAALVQILPVQTLFLVHRKDLLHQTAEVFSKYGIDVGLVGDGWWDSGHQVTIATIQSLLGKKTEKNPELLLFLSDIEQVIFDEAHHIAATVQKGNTFVYLSRRLNNAFLRWGLTATPFMKDKYSDLLLEGATGSVLYQKKSAELIDEGHLTPPEIEMILMSKNNEIADSWPSCYTRGIARNKVRNQRVAEEAITSKHPALILVQHIEHGLAIQEEFEKKNLYCRFLCGDDTSEERRSAIKDLKEGRSAFLIATTIFDEGIDIPEIRTLILAGGGKSEIRGLQRLGRGLRLAEGKDKLRVVDFMDYTTNILKKHSRMRKMIWEREGFKVKTTP